LAPGHLEYLDHPDSSLALSFLFLFLPAFLVLRLVLALLAFLVVPALLALLCSLALT
jgi:hypothetical protein